MLPGMADAESEPEKPSKAKRKRDLQAKARSEYTESGPILKELKPGSPSKSSAAQLFPCEENAENIDPTSGLGELSLNDTDICCAVNEQPPSLPSFEHFVKSTAGVPISSLELALRPVYTSTPGSIDRVPQMRVVLQTRKGDASSNQDWCYDVDIGFLITGETVRRDGPAGAFYRCTPGPSAYSMLVLRKSYFAFIRGVAQGTNERLFAYPNTIVVSNKRYKIHHCAGDETFCYAVSNEMDFRLMLLRNQLVTHPLPSATVTPAAVPSAVVPIVAPPGASTVTIHSHVLLVIVGAPASTLDEHAETHERAARVGFELPAGFKAAALLRGKVLWEPFYGEVYKGHLLRRKEGTPNDPVFDFHGAQAVAIKVMRHLNDHSGPLERNYHNVQGKYYPPLPCQHHDIPTPAGGSSAESPQLYSSHMSPYFEAQCARGKNENLVNEMEIMDFIARSIARLVANTDGFDTDESAAAMQQRFFPMMDVALCANNLFVVTKFTPYGNLLDYKDRNGLNRNMDERSCQHVIYQILQGLCFLHLRGIAHQDLSLENTLLQAPLNATDDLLAMVAQFLSLSDFLKLDVVIIDMGHVAVHEPVLEGSYDSIRHSASNVSSATVDTATTCESTSGRSNNINHMDVCDDCASPGPEVRDVDANCAETTASRAPAPSVCAHSCRYHKRSAAKNCVGKRLYHCPELSQSAASARAALRATIAANVAAAQAQQGATSAESAASGSSASSSAPASWAPAPAPQEGQDKVLYCGMCVDMWQLGVLLIYLITGRPPYEFFNIPPADQLRNEITWFEDVALGRLAQRPVAWRDGNGVKTFKPLREFVSADCFDLLEKLLCFDPDQRISAEKALQHPWFKDLC